MMNKISKMDLLDDHVDSDESPYIYSSGNSRLENNILDPRVPGSPVKSLVTIAEDRALLQQCLKRWHSNPQTHWLPPSMSHPTSSTTNYW